MCFTCFVSLDDSESTQWGYKVELDSQTHAMRAGDVLVLKSRHAGPYSFAMNEKKSLGLVFWVNGPFDLKEKRF